MIISSLIRQKWQSQNRCFKKAKRVKFSEKQTFLTPDTQTYVYAHFSLINDEMCKITITQGMF